MALICGGFGDRIEWKRFGDVDPLEDNENQSISTKVSYGINCMLTDQYFAYNNCIHGLFEANSHKV